MYESYIFIIFFIILTLFIYLKIETIYAVKFPLLVVIVLFSFIIIPFTFDFELIGTPYIQIFFIIFQMVILVFSSYEYYTLKNKLKDK